MTNGNQPATARAERRTVEVRVRGTVQGVGFRPTVWRLARQEGVAGSIVNDGDGVKIEATGDARALQRFVDRIETDAPPLARIEQIEVRQLPEVADAREFRIAPSHAGENHTRVAADASLCAACRDEVLDPDQRRHRYPFANCTHCGPRFSIVNAVPYDRGHTTMARFAMCADCAREYDNPADRRFHAQPIACPACGPRVWLEPLRSASADEPVEGEDAIDQTARMLRAGAIVAIRGLGGFHLACDATDADAVARLRARKQRFGKPFALMARDVAAIRGYCRVSATEQELLQSSAAPIVVLQADGPQTLPEALAPGLRALGFMLPYTPLHLLLLQDFDTPLVMTSGNLSDEPQVTLADEARARLGDIADFVLMHDRDIANRIDDSVVKVIDDQPRRIRLARGYAPSFTPLPEGFADAPDLLAYGGELKSTFCLLKDGAAILSQHQGDLEDARTFDDYQHNLQLYAQLYDHRPQLLVADQHPEYLSSKLARTVAEAQGLPLVEVQHHHAHVASCMAENGEPLTAQPVLGIALDGLGYGADQTIWGGEFLLADYREFRRLGALKPIAMLGGAQAIHEPWRNSYAHLVAAMGWEEFAARYADLELCRRLSDKPLPMLERMLERGINSPQASSCGRLFDAVAAALGLCAERASFEGQGAMELETLAEAWLQRHPDDLAGYPFAIGPGPDGLPCQLDAAPMWPALLDDLRASRPDGAIAARFHRGLADAICQMTGQIGRHLAPDSRFDAVALTGGCFQNALLLDSVSKSLRADGYRCLTHSRLPSNDGGLALGQATIAAARELAGQTAQPTKAPQP